VKERVWPRLRARDQTPGSALFGFGYGLDPAIGRSTGEGLGAGILSRASSRGRPPGRLRFGSTIPMVRVARAEGPVSAARDSGAGGYFNAGRSKSTPATPLLQQGNWRLQGSRSWVRLLPSVMVCPISRLVVARTAAIALHAGRQVWRGGFATSLGQGDR